MQKSAAQVVPRATQPLRTPSDTLHYPTQKTVFYQELGPAAKISFCPDGPQSHHPLAGGLRANSPFPIRQPLKWAGPHGIDQSTDLVHTQSTTVKASGLWGSGTPGSGPPSCVYCTGAFTPVGPRIIYSTGVSGGIKGVLMCKHHYKQ